MEKYRRLLHNNKMDLKEVGVNVMNWIELADSAVCDSGT